MAKPNDNTDWIKKEMRQQWNTNCNALRINNPELDPDEAFILAKTQVDKGFELYPDFVATQEVIDGETGKTLEEVIQI